MHTINAPIPTTIHPPLRSLVPVFILPEVLVGLATVPVDDGPVPTVPDRVVQPPVDEPEVRVQTGSGISLGYVLVLPINGLSHVADSVLTLAVVVVIGKKSELTPGHFNAQSV